MLISQIVIDNLLPPVNIIMGHLLLISSDKIKPAIPPVGLEYIAESLSNNGHEVDLIDMCLEKSPEKIIQKKILSNDYSAIGIGIRIMGNDILEGSSFKENSLPQIKNLIYQIRKITKAPIILGGASFSLEPTKIIRYLKADYGIKGCGIPALEILLKKIKRGQINAGVIFRYKSPKYLDFVFKRSMLDLTKYSGYCQLSKGIGVNTKEGCGLDCLFCPYIEIGTKLRLRSPSKVVEEIENLTERGISRIFFADEIFNAPPRHSYEICTKIIKKKLSIQWSATMSPFKRHLPGNLIKLMIRSGLFAARFRIGSGSEKILKNLGRSYTKDDIEYTTRQFQVGGVKVLWVLNFGAPGETKKTIDETFGLVDKLNPEEVIIQIGLRIYKLTKLGKFIKKSPVSLFRPAFYPFKLGEYVIQEKFKRENCH